MAHFTVSRWRRTYLLVVILLFAVLSHGSAKLKTKKTRRTDKRIPNPPSAGTNKYFLMPPHRGNGPNNQYAFARAGAVFAHALNRTNLLAAVLRHRSTPDDRDTYHPDEIWDKENMVKPWSAGGWGSALLSDVQGELRNMSAALIGCGRRMHRQVNPDGGIMVQAGNSELVVKHVHCFGQELGSKPLASGDVERLVQVFRETGVSRFDVIIGVWNLHELSPPPALEVEATARMKPHPHLAIAADAFIEHVGLHNSTFLGVHARRGDFGNHCFRQVREPFVVRRDRRCPTVNRFRMTPMKCFASPYVVVRSMNSVRKDDGRFTPGGCDTDKLVVATNEVNATFFDELQETFSSSGFRMSIVSFRDLDVAVEKERGKRLPDGWELTPLRRSKVEQVVMERACLFLGSPISTWATTVFLRRRTVNPQGACGFLGEGV